MAFIASPEIVVAYALAGRLDFEPADATRSTGADGERVQARRRRRRRPSCPRDGFVASATGYVAPPADGARGRASTVDPDSERLAAARRRSRRGTARTSIELPLLLKAKGKCTTDHISPAGPWLTLPRPPRQHQRQHVHRRDQRVHRRDRQGTEPAHGRARTVPFPKIARALQGARAALGRGRRRELRRGLEPRARRDVAALPRRRGGASCAASRASTRPT